MKEFHRPSEKTYVQGWGFVPAEIQRLCVSASVTASQKKKKKTQYCILEVSLNATIEAVTITTCTALTPSGPTHTGTPLFSALVMQSEK